MGVGMSVVLQGNGIVSGVESDGADGKLFQRQASMNFPSQIRDCGGVLLMFFYCIGKGRGETSMRSMITAILLFATIGLAQAQTAAPANPLRPQARTQAAAQPAPAAPTAAPAPDRPKRERSEAQKRNDEDMRACGADWREKKPQLQAAGQTWITFSKDCRARRRATRGA
jgi:predicted lipid-binding transport protein (Tim44 family)